MTEKLNIKQLKPISTNVNLGTSDVLLPTQNAVKTYVDNGLSTKQNTLTAGTNITIDANNVISAALDPTEYYNKTQTDALLDLKQDVISDLTTIRSGAALGTTAVQPGDLATVATSGSYEDLTNKPTIPTKTSDLTNDSDFITSSYHDATKQDKLTAGQNITIDANNVISATGQVSVSFSSITGQPTDNTNLAAALNTKQDTLIAGTNIQIAADGKTISATDTTYTAGTGIDITNGVISNTQTSAEWGNITGTLSDQTDLKNALDGKANVIHTHHGNDITTGTVYYGIIRGGGSTYSTVEFDSTVNIVKGDTLIVKWNLAQGTSRNLKMNTNGSPSIPLMYKGSQIAENTLSSGDVMQVTYDGSAWQIMSVNKWVAPVPTKTSDLTNDSDYQTGTQVSTAISTHNTDNTAHNDIRTEVSAKSTCILRQW